MKSEKVRKFFVLCPKNNNDIRLRRAKALHNENAVISSKRRPRLPERGARGENMSVSFANRRMLSLRQNKDSRRVGGHAPPQRHLERSAATMKTRFTGRTSFLRSEGVISPSYSKKSVFSRTCAGKRHTESRERGDRKGVNGGKREGERSERESVVTRHKNHEYLITCVNIPWTTYLSSGFDATFVQVESVMMRLFASNFTFLPICDFAYMALRNSR